MHKPPLPEGAGQGRVCERCGLNSGNPYKREATVITAHDAPAVVAAPQLRP